MFVGISFQVQRAKVDRSGFRKDDVSAVFGAHGQGRLHKMRAFDGFGEDIRFAGQVRICVNAADGGVGVYVLVVALIIPGSSERYLVRIADFSRLSKANIIFDYSRINLHNIHSNVAFQAYAEKTFCISPMLYPLYISTEGREGSITLFGNPNDSRRKDFLESLKKHRVESRNVQGVYSNLDAVYRQAKIVINIRQTEHHDTLEELRVLPALRSGAIVICESAPYAEKTWYSKFILWGTLAELPDLIADTQINYNQIHAQIFGTLELNSPFMRRMNRIELCNKLVAEKATRKLNRDVVGH